MEFKGKEILMRFRHDRDYSLEDAYKDFLNLFDVSGSELIEFNNNTTVANGIYKVKTNKGRVIGCEFTFNRWFELDEPIEEGERVIGYYR